MSKAFKAMMFAREVHKDQRRKYTKHPYFDHLAEVAGITASVMEDEMYAEEAVAIAWLHDCVEDQSIPIYTLSGEFGHVVSEGVWWLSDTEQGNRSKRKQLARERLAEAPDYIQTIKCADLISNTSSIVEHDPDFAILFLKEMKLLLDVMKSADPRLLKLARGLL